MTCNVSDNMKTNLLRMTCGVAAMLAADTVFGESGWVSRIPNGNVNSCSTCHGANGPPGLNPFGSAFLANNLTWTAALANQNSDGDAFSNGQELGDPNGDGTPIPGASVGNPGVASSVPTATPPNISLTSPANGGSFAAPFTGPITASSTLPAEAITAVQFFSGSTLLGTDTTAPYSLAVNLGAGGYTLTARAISYLAASNTSSAVTITVSSAAVPPSIVTPPASRTVTVGANVTFTVSAGGTPPLSYQWQKNTANIPGATASSFALASVTAADAGSYRVVVTNTAGTATSAAATLTVNPAPVAPTITIQPVSQSVNAGANVSFTVAATGTAPLSYQWRRNAVAISGATGTALNLNAVTTANAGSYSVVVTNAAGSATSATATLTVTQTVVIVSITTPTNGATFSAPATFELTASATPAASITRVDFFLGSMLIGSVPAAPYTFNVINLGVGSHRFTARAVSSSGTTTSAPVNVTVTGPPPPVGPAVVTVIATDPDASEAGPDPGTFRVARTGPATNALTVYYLLGGTALNGEDYQLIPTNVTIAAGSTTADITIIPILDVDIPPEISDAVILQLIGPPDGQPGYTIGSPSNAVVTIIEVISSNLPPVVQMVSPRNGSSYRAGANILLAAMASDPDGRVVNVEFFAGMRDLGSGVIIGRIGDREEDDDDDDRPGNATTVYGFNWRRVPAGQYVITAVATDDAGATTISAPVRITVRRSGGGGGGGGDRDRDRDRGGDD
jgi:hypothetical protein